MALDANRKHLLDAQTLDAVLSILNSYLRDSSSPPSINDLKLIKTGVGVLLNASVGYGEYLALETGAQPLTKYVL